MPTLPVIAGLLAQWKADAGVLNGSSVTPSNGGAIATWADQSGNSNTLTTETTGHLGFSVSGTPTYATNFANNLPAVYIQGANQQSAPVGPSMYSGLTTTQPTTTFLVYSPVANAGFVFDSTNAGARNVVLISSNTQYDMYAGADGLYTVPTITNTPTVLTNIFNGALSRARVDGVQYNISANPGSSGMTGFRLGARYAGGSNANAYFMEVLVYNSALSLANIQAVEYYLSVKWGLIKPVMAGGGWRAWWANIDE